MFTVPEAPVPGEMNKRSDRCILDSGCTRHTTSCHDNFVLFNEVKSTACVCNSDIILYTGHGMASLRCTVSGKTNTVVLQNVLSCKTFSLYLRPD